MFHSLTPCLLLLTQGQSQARRRKNMTEFLGDANIPSPDSLAQLGGSLPTIASSSYDKQKNTRPTSRFSGFFFTSYKVRTWFPFFYMAAHEESVSWRLMRTSQGNELQSKREMMKHPVVNGVSFS